MKIKVTWTIYLTILILGLFYFEPRGFANNDSFLRSENIGDGHVNLYRPVKQERLSIQYRDKRGNYIPEAFDKIAYFFRCRLEDEVHDIDPGLIEIIDSMEDHFGAKEVQLISAYRSPERNAKMRASGNTVVAEKSLHMSGMAADVQIDGVSAKEAREFAYTLKRGGVGAYSGRPFIHVDTGGLRTWGWKPTLSMDTHALAQHIPSSTFLPHDGNAHESFCSRLISAEIY